MVLWSILFSVGHLAIDALASRLGIHMVSCRGGFTGTGKVFVGSDTFVELTLYKSSSSPRSLSWCWLDYSIHLESLMNISGPSIVQAYRQSLPSPNSTKTNPLIVLADSLSHRPLAISPKLGGSANGHNGVKSIIGAFGTMEFYRLRLGIGSNRTGGCVDAADYVLAPLSSQEKEWWTGDGVDAVLKWIQQMARDSGVSLCLSISSHSPCY